MHRPAKTTKVILTIFLFSHLIVLGTVAGFAQPGTISIQDAQGRLKSAIGENSDKLAELHRRIKEVQAEEVSLDSRAAQVSGDQERLVNKIEMTRDLLGGLDQRERLLHEQSTTLSGQLNSSQKHYEHQKQALARSLRAMYTQSSQHELEMIMTAGSFSEMMTRIKFNGMLTSLAGNLIADTRQRGTKIETEQRELDVALAEIWESREDAGLEQGRLELLEAEYIATLRELKSERSGLKERLLELSANEQRLTYIMSDLEQQRSEHKAIIDLNSSDLVTMAGKLEWPVIGRVMRGFGRSVHPRFKTVTLNNGINIEASIGAPVASVAAGEVEFSDNLPGFGQCVILDHGAGYYTLYAYLDQVFVAAEDAVSAGQVIAEVGRPAGEQPAQLYFEVRHGRTPLDPADWLK